MSIYYRLQKEPILQTPCVFTFGTFDGVHLGHKAIFEKQAQEAKLHNLPTGILTFSNHPSDVLTPGITSSMLTSDKQKLEQLKLYGFTVIVDIPFDDSLRTLSADTFLKTIRTMVPFSSLIVGPDVSFGKDRKGDKKYLDKLNKEFSLMVVEKICIDGQPVSSSRIRQVISEGNFQAAEKLLGRPYCIEVKRCGENEWDPLNFALPPRGIYEAQVTYNDQTICRELKVKVSSILEIDDSDEESHSAQVQFTKFLKEST